jgi:class 3 adenylate cyclase
VKPLVPAQHVQSFGPIALRGKAEPIPVYSIRL